jgi:hypothetical protein
MPDDAKLRFADGESIIVNAAAEIDPIGDYLNLGTNRKDMFPGENSVPNDLGDCDLELVVAVSTALVGSGSVLTFQLMNHDAASNFSTGNEILQFTVTVPAAGIAAGEFLARMPLPRGRITEQYVALIVTAATANLTAGAVDAMLTKPGERNQAHGNAATQS